MTIYTPPPRSPAAPEALKALSAVPGPSPWYLVRPGTEVEHNGEVLRWRSAGQDTVAAGKSVLTSALGDVLAVADCYCYAQPLSDARLLVWYLEENDDGSRVQRWMRFRIVELERLRPIRDVVASFAKLGRHSRFCIEAGESVTWALSTDLPGGVNHVELPDEMTGLGELLVLAQSTATDRVEDHANATQLRLWLLDTARRQLEVVPQDWFNEGDYDFGYQWVTRVARLPGSGAIVGEGIRLGIFKLDDSKRRIAEWLAEDIFYHPGR